jgi:Ras-related protein Rab-8A
VKHFAILIYLQHADVNVNKILIGNKCDVQDQRAISYEEGEALAKEYNIHFYETSAKQDLNVEKSFITIATDVKNRLIADGGAGAVPGGHKLAPGGGAAAAKKGGCC